MSKYGDENAKVTL